jgi:ssDNA-binding replication factor A large subunit
MEAQEVEHECRHGSCTEYANTTACVDYGDLITHNDYCEEHLQLTKKNWDVIDVTYWD